MDLTKFSKADLIWIVNRALQMASLSNSDYYLRRAISDLGYEKEKQRIASAEKYSKIADEKRRQYIELLSAYDGQRLIDIPLEVLNKADKLIKEANEADKKWSKLVGINIDD